MAKKNVPRIVWELGVLGILLILVFGIQYSTPFFSSPEAQFVRTYSSGSASFSLVAVTSGTKGEFSSSNYGLNVISGDTGGLVENQNYKLYLGSSQLIYPLGIVGPPQFLDHDVTTSDGTNIYSGPKLYSFKVNILGESTIDFASFTLIKPDGQQTTYTLGNGLDRIGDRYFASFTFLPAGNYTYRWFARDLNGQTSLDQNRLYSVNKAIPGLNFTLNGKSESLSVSRGTVVTIKSTTLNNPDLNMILSVNGQSILTNRDTLTYAFDTSNYQNGIYKIEVSVIGNQNWTDFVETRNITIANINYSNIKTVPDTGVVFKPIENYRFSSAWSGDVSDVILEFNGANYSFIGGQLTKAGNSYFRDFPNLSAGGYAYRWHANDTVGTWTRSDISIYEIKKAKPLLKLFIDNQERSKVYPQNTIVNVKTTLTIEKLIKLTITRPDQSIRTDTGVLQVERNDVIDLLGLYKVFAQFDNEQNYTGSSITKWLVSYDPNNPDVVAPNSNDQGQTANKAFENDNLTLWIDTYDVGSLIDIIKLRVNETGSFVTKESRIIDAPFGNITMNYTVPIGTSGTTVTWFVLVNDSFNNIYTSPALSFTVYDWADIDYNRAISMLELSRVISRFLRGEGSQTQIAKTIQRWLNGGTY